MRLARELKNLIPLEPVPAQAGTGMNGVSIALSGKRANCDAETSLPNQRLNITPRRMFGELAPADYGRGIFFPSLG